MLTFRQFLNERFENLMSKDGGTGEVTRKEEKPKEKKASFSNLMSKEGGTGEVTKSEKPKETGKRWFSNLFKSEPDEPAPAKKAEPEKKASKPDHPKTGFGSRAEAGKRWTTYHHWKHFSYKDKKKS